MAKAASKPSPQRKSSLQAPIFAVLMYFLYGLPRNFKFKQKYQQYDLYFQIIFLFLMTMLKDNHKKQGEVALSRSQDHKITVKITRMQQNKYAVEERLSRTSTSPKPV